MLSPEIFSRVENVQDVNVLFLVYRESFGPIFSSVYVNPAERLTKFGISARILTLGSIGEFVKPSLRRRWPEFSRELRRRLPRGVARLPSPPRRFRWLPADQMVLRAWAAFDVHRKQPSIIHCGGSIATQLALGLRRRYRNVQVV